MIPPQLRGIAHQQQMIGEHLHQPDTLLTLRQYQQVQKVTAQAKVPQEAQAQEAQAQKAQAQEARAQEAQALLQLVILLQYSQLHQDRRRRLRQRLRLGQRLAFLPLHLQLLFGIKLYVLEYLTTEPSFPLQTTIKMILIRLVVENCGSNPFFFWKSMSSISSSSFWRFIESEIINFRSKMNKKNDD